MRFQGKLAKKRQLHAYLLVMLSKKLPLRLLLKVAWPVPPAFATNVAVALFATKKQQSRVEGSKVVETKDVGSLPLSAVASAIN